MARPSIAVATSSGSGMAGAIRMLRSRGSRPYGNAAPAAVMAIPACLASATTRVAVPSLDLQQDLWKVLSWADEHRIRLDRLSASEASLAAVFRRVSLAA